MGEDLHKNDMGQRLRECRKNAKLSIKECAKLVGVSTIYLGDIERGNKAPKLDTFIRMLNILGASADYVLQDSIHVAIQDKSTRLDRLISEFPAEQQRQLLNICESVVEGYQK